MTVDAAAALALKDPPCLRCELLMRPCFPNTLGKGHLCWQGLTPEPQDDSSILHRDSGV